MILYVFLYDDSKKVIKIVFRKKFNHTLIFLKGNSSEKKNQSTGLAAKPWEKLFKKKKIGPVGHYFQNFFGQNWPPPQKKEFF